MKIAIDIDNTILYCKSKLYSLYTKLDRNKNVNSIGKIQSFEKNTARVYSTKYRKFFGALGDISKYKEIDGAIEAVNNFKKNGNQVVFLSSRPNIKVFNGIILEWLDKKNVDYDLCVVNCKNKAKFCAESGVDLLIDDSMFNCETANKNGIETIWFNSNEKTPNSSKQSNSTTFHTAKDWTQIEKISNEIIKKKQNNLIQRDKPETENFPKREKPLKSKSLSNTKKLSENLSKNNYDLNEREM